MGDIISFTALGLDLMGIKYLSFGCCRITGQNGFGATDR